MPGLFDHDDYNDYDYDDYDYDDFDYNDYDHDDFDYNDYDNDDFDYDGFAYDDFQASPHSSSPRQAGSGPVSLAESMQVIIVIIIQNDQDGDMMMTIHLYSGLSP